MGAKLLLMVPFTYSAFACKSHNAFHKAVLILASQYCCTKCICQICEAFVMEFWFMRFCGKCAPVKMYLLITWLCQWHITAKCIGKFVGLQKYEFFDRKHLSNDWCTFWALQIIKGKLSVVWIASQNVCIWHDWNMFTHSRTILKE